MKRKSLVHMMLAVVVAVMLAAMPGMAQEITGVPGSPSATVTIDGKQLPAPPEKFGGVIKERAVDSTPYWPARVVPPKGAPNILLIMTDDAGYGVASTFGGVIPTPALDRIGKNGLRYTNFHSTALCSPTRAAIITGRNHHSAGFGVVSEQSTGFPGYNYDIERVRRCVVHYAAPNGLLYPFCAYNSGPTYRDKIERKYSMPFEQQPEFLALNGNGNGSNGAGSPAQTPELVTLG